MIDRNFEKSTGFKGVKIRKKKYIFILEYARDRISW